MTEGTATSKQGARTPLSPSLDAPQLATPEREQAIRTPNLLAIVVEHWRALISTALVAAAIVVGVLFAIPIKFDATVTVAPISSPRQLSLPTGLAGSLLGAANSGGLQATPVFVARLARLNSVLTDVALTRIPGDTGRAVVEALLHKPLAAIKPHTYARELDRVLVSTIDRESGTVTLGFALRDSALARVAVDALLSAVRRTYARTNKSQATEMREAQLTRVDSTARLLKQAQTAVVNFAASNRIVPTYSSIWIEGQRLQGNLSVAQSVYTAAVSDLSAAQGKELEDAPALVILDSVPTFLPPRSRYVVSKSIIAAILGAFVALAFVIVREAATNVARAGDPDSRRLLEAVAQLPVVRGPVFRWFVRERLPKDAHSLG